MAHKIYYYDDDFFRKIDSEEKAYYLGFLYADGYINDIGYNCYVELTLQTEDKYIQEKFFNDLKSNRIPSKIKMGKYSKMIINSKKIVSDLKKLGCINKKTHVLKFPNELDEKYIHHMIRGYFDGDGSIWCSGDNNQYHISFTGNVDFLVGIEEYILRNLPLDKKEHYSPCNRNRKPNIKVLKYGGNQIVSKILGLLYNDSHIYLNRKYEKYLDAKGKFKERNHIVILDGITYDSYNKGKLIDILQSKTIFNRDIISSRLIKGWTPSEIITNKRIKK